MMLVPEGLLRAVGRPRATGDSVALRQPPGPVMTDPHRGLSARCQLTAALCLEVFHPALSGNVVPPPRKTRQNGQLATNR